MALGRRRRHREIVSGTSTLAGIGSRRNSGSATGSPPVSDNRSSNLEPDNIADDVVKWIKGQNIKHVRGVPYNPMTRTRIERWHQTLKTRILWKSRCPPGDFQAQITGFTTDRSQESTDI